MIAEITAEIARLNRMIYLRNCWISDCQECRCRYCVLWRDEADQCILNALGARRGAGAPDAYRGNRRVYQHAGIHEDMTMTCEEVREFCRTHPDPVDCTVAETLAVWNHAHKGGCKACREWIEEGVDLSIRADSEADREHVRKVIADPEFRRILAEKRLAFREKGL